MKVLKIIGVVFGILILLVIALAIAVPLLFDINDYKDRIAAEVEDETGRELTIVGDLDLTIFPWFGVRTGAMSLAQAPGFDETVPFAAFTASDVRVRLMPLLLRRDLEIGRIAFDGLQVNLERDVDGRDNWSDLVERERPEREPEPRDPDEVDFDLDRIRIEGIVFSDARVTFRDAQAGTSYTLEELNLRTGAIRADRPVELSLDARVSSGVPQWRGTVEFDGRADYQVDAQTLALVIEGASVDLEGGALPVDRLRASLSGRVDGNLESEAWDAQDLLVELTGRGGRLPDRDFAANLSGRVSADLAEQTAELADFVFEGLGVRASFSASGSGIVDAPVFTGRAMVDAFSPRRVLADLGRELPETNDPEVFTHLQFAGDFRATTTSIVLDGLDARLDDSRLTGRFEVADLEREALRFELALDHVDVDRYLPPDTPEPEAVDVGAFDDIAIPEELIRGLDVEGTLRIARMSAVGLESEDIEVGVRARDGVLRVHPSRARLYGGTYLGDVSIDVRGDLPRLSMHERLDGVQAGPLFEDLFGATRITGGAEMSAQLTAAGQTIGQMRPTLDGRIVFAFRDGAVQGFDLWHLMRDARAVVRQESRPTRADGPEQTRFGNLAGTGVVRQGVMTNDDLAGDLPFMRLAGRGTIDLVQQELDYRLDVTVLDQPGVDQAGLGELRGRTVPVRIAGPFDELAYRVDVASVLQERVREEVEERIDEQRERLEDRLRDRLRRIQP